MKKTVLFIFILMCCAGLQAQNNTEEMHLETASVQKALNLIPEGMEQRFGFKSREELKKGKTGTPLQVYLIDIEGNLTKLNEFRVPVMIDNEKRLLLTVVKNADDQPEIVDIGGSPLAKELDGIAIPVKDIDMLIRSYDYKMDFVASSNSFFGTDSSLKCIVPLQSARLFFKGRREAVLEHMLSQEELQLLFHQSSLTSSN